MSWILVRAEFEPMPPDLSPAIEVYRDFGVENTLEDDSGLQGCLADVAGAQATAASLAEALKAMGAERVFVEPYIEQDWEIAWRQFFKPRRVGSRFWVCPTWETVEPAEGEILLVLDPGQAFGTGDHPTTRLCLELLESVSLSGARVADVGCGSGVLAIAAAKLGAEVLAIDIDPIALEVAAENATRNGVSLRLSCGDGLEFLASEVATAKLAGTAQDDEPLQGVSVATAAPFVLPGENFDLVVSNIISATLIRLGAQITHALLPGGVWIVSGIIEQNWPEVEAAAKHLGMVLERCQTEDGWVAALFRKPTLANEP